MAKTALLAGASGLVGGHCLRLLLESPEYSKIVSVGRRELPLKHPKLEQRVVDFSAPDLPPADDVFCCLGTTIKKAGSQEAFRRIDFGYPWELAKAALGKGAKKFLLVTAAGSDARSRIFYSRIKGELEEAVSALPFKSVHILRPSLLLGDRREFRLIEKVAEPLMRALSIVMVGPLRKHRPIEAARVAQAMLLCANVDTAGVDILESDRIAARAKSRG